MITGDGIDTGCSRTGLLQRSSTEIYDGFKLHHILVRHREVGCNTAQSVPNVDSKRSFAECQTSLNFAGSDSGASLVFQDFS